MLLNALFIFQAQTRTETAGWYNVIFFVLIGLVFYFILLRPQMKQQRDQRSLLDSLKKGDKVITGGGIWGEIDSVEAATVRLKVNEKTKITVSKSAISGRQPSKDAGASAGND